MQLDRGALMLAALALVLATHVIAFNRRSALEEPQLSLEDVPGIRTVPGTYSSTV
jgi:hypothetical protein